MNSDQTSRRNGTRHQVPRSLRAVLLVLLGIAQGLTAEPLATAIPIAVQGKTFSLTAGLSRGAVKEQLASIFADRPSVDNTDFLQYDAILVPDQGPTSFAFQFDGQGVLTDLSIDAYLKEQNPPVQGLLRWLQSHAGRPRARRKGQLVWEYQGWRIEHRFGGSGEDSSYRMEFSRLKSNGH